VTAYTLGMRHAFDADHISAIDNTTRKLMADGKQPLSVGLFFSLGHSTIVFVLALLFAAGLRSLNGPVRNASSSLHTATGLAGTGVSGAFLYLIAALNAMILWGVVKVFLEMRTGRYSELELEHQLASRGLMNRVFGRFTGAVSKPWHMYPVGALFGLGFDTASEVALLCLAAGAAPRARFGVGSRTSASTRSGSSSSGCSSARGRSRWPYGASGGSRNGGARHSTAQRRVSAAGCRTRRHAAT
jgi:nickel/cobalt transporter (NiCoT) family protein